MTEAFGPPSLTQLEDASSFLTAVGLRFTEVTGRRVTGTLELGRRHHTPRCIVHGGVYTTAVESAASVAGGPRGHDELPRGVVA
jgi:1,4-dihydroxy-2-naphthoyl-CoA hydrolase